MIKGIFAGAFACLCMLFAQGGECAPVNTARDLKAVWRTDVAATQTTELGLFKLVPGGAARNIKLSGVSNTQVFDFTVRADEVVAAAHVDLDFLASSVVLPNISQLNFYMNGKLQGSVPLKKEMIGSRTSIDVPLDPKSIVGQNQLAIEFVGHYQTICENPNNRSLWLDISESSRLVLVKQSVRLANNIAQFPVPFIDPHSSGMNVLPMVFASAPNAAQKTAAAILAGYVGKHSLWKGANFPVHYNEAPASGHFVVFVTNEERPEFLKDFPKVDGPQVTIADSGLGISEKMLVVAGRNDEDLVVAAKAITRDSNVMIGDTFRVRDFADSPKRKAYDADGWIDTGTVTKFSKFVTYPGQLTSRGYDLYPVHVGMRLVPDLFMVSDAVLDMNLKYRVSRVLDGEKAQMRVFSNGFLTDSQNIATDVSQDTLKVSLPGFYGSLVDSTRDALGLGIVNDLSFSVLYERTSLGGNQENCKSVTLMPHQMEIDPSSTITVDGLYHWAKLPDLRLFERAGFPFTKYADLSETVVLIGDGAGASQVSVMLNQVARMCASTGVVGSGITVADRIGAEHRNKDILIVAGAEQLLSDANEAKAEELQRQVSQTLSGRDFIREFAGRTDEVVSENGIAAIVAVQSPFDSSRSVVALLGEGSEGMAVLGKSISTTGAMASVRGSVAVLNDSETICFAVGDTYNVGNLPWQHRIWMSLMQKPLAVVAFALISAILVGFAVFYLLRLWVRGRAK